MKKTFDKRKEKNKLVSVERNKAESTASQREQNNMDARDTNPFFYFYAKYIANNSTSTQRYILGGRQRESLGSSL